MSVPQKMVMVGKEMKYGVELMLRSRLVRLEEWQAMTTNGLGVLSKIE